MEQNRLKSFNPGCNTQFDWLIEKIPDSPHVKISDSPHVKIQDSPHVKI